MLVVQPDAYGTRAKLLARAAGPDAVRKALHRATEIPVTDPGPRGR